MSQAEPQSPKQLLKALAPRPTPVLQLSGAGKPDWFGGDITATFMIIVVACYSDKYICNYDYVALRSMRAFCSGVLFVC